MQSTGYVGPAGKSPKKLKAAKDEGDFNRAPKKVRPEAAFIVCAIRPPFNFKARKRNVRVGLDLRSEPLLVSAFRAQGTRGSKTARYGDRSLPVLIMRNGRSRP